MVVHRTRQLRPTRRHCQQLVDGARPHRRPERRMEEVDQNEVGVPSRSAPVAFENVGAYARTSRSSTGTQGHLVGEIIRRITGKTLKEFVCEEIAAPLGADIQIGARAEDDDRIAELVPPPPLDVPRDAVPEDHPMRQTFSAPPLTPGNCGSRQHHRLAAR
jgi:hypothetical protein